MPFWGVINFSMKKGNEKHRNLAWLSLLSFLSYSGYEIPVNYPCLGQLSLAPITLSPPCPVFHFILYNFNWNLPHGCCHTPPVISAPRHNLAAPPLLPYCQKQNQTDTANTRWEKMSAPFYHRCYHLIFSKSYLHTTSAIWYLSPHAESRDAAAAPMLTTNKKTDAALAW